ncbi:Ig-like domain-containing protein [Candidatus Parcubacteria bacterium]|nr:Ig-like domain-containing protein [Candidatus Parcubacteria bacterium]
MKRFKHFFKKAAILSVVFLLASYTVPLDLYTPTARAAEITIVGYGPPNGMTNMPTMAPLDFMFSSAPNSTVLNSLSSYFLVSPSIDGTWEYMPEYWGDQTMHRVSFMATNNLAANTEYTVSVNRTNFGGDTVTASLPSEMTDLSTTTDTYYFTARTDDGSGSGGFFLPMADAGYPSYGMQQVPTSLTSITINFDRDNMDATTFIPANIYLVKVSTGTVAGTTVTPNTGTSNVASIQTFSLDPSSQYRVYVTRDVKDNTGQLLAGMPDVNNNNNPGPFYYDFWTGDSSAAITSTFIGTNLNQYLSGENITGVPTGFVITATFDNPLDPTTVSTSSVAVSTTTPANGISGTVEYNSQANMISFISDAVFATSTEYTFTASTSITSISGQAISAVTQAFTTTATTDETSPEIYFADADNYGLFVEFSEPMNQTKVENKSNYTLKTRVSDATAWGSATAVSLTSANIRYEHERNEVMMDGLTLTPGHEFQLTASTSITDLAGNALDDSGDPAANIKTGYVMDSSMFFGDSGMFGGGMDFEDFNMGDMGMKPIGVWPMSSMIGVTTKYFIDIPTTAAIDSDGTIELKFPSGFDVTSVIQDAQSPSNDDFNEWNDGTITFTSDNPANTENGGAAGDGIGVIGDRVIVIKLSAAVAADNFLHIDLDGIQNSSTPKGFETDGYQVEIKTKNSSGILLETMNSMPFFISGGGTNTISGTITATGDANGSTMVVYLGSPMTGPMQTTSAAFANATSSYSFANLPDGEYFLFTDPTITMGGTTYFGNPMPEPIWLSGGDTTKNLTLTAETAGTVFDLTVKLIGDFRSGDPLTDDNVDIFAGSPSGFRVKTATPGNTPSGTDYHLYLPVGEWMVGVGPAMPTGVMSGPPLMPDWMPPMPTSVKIIDASTSSVAGGILTINLGSQVSTTITGTVVDENSEGIASAEVFAYQPMGGFGGAHSKTAVDGTFTLKIPVLGTYKIGAFKPGLPDAQEITQDVPSGGVSGLTIKMQKPAYTISGQIRNASDQAIPYAAVWTHQVGGFGHSHTMADASGNYILYIDNGTWTVEADAHGVGWMEYGSNITINGSSQGGINLSPSSNLTWYTIGGTITIDGSAQAYLPIRAVEFDANGYYLGKEYGGSTDANGVYSISVPGTGSAVDKYYRVDIWTPNYGEVELSSDGVENSPANITVSNANKTGANITIETGDLETATISFANSSTYSNKEAFIHIDGVSCSGNDCMPTGFHRSIRVDDISAGNQTVSLEAGNYFFFVDVPGTGHFIPSSSSDAFNTDKGCIVIDGTDDNILFALPDLTGSSVITISGAVSGPDEGQRDAWVWIGNPDLGFHTGTSADASSGAYSMVIPKLSSGNYMIGADKPGYMSSEPVSNNGTASTTINFTLTAYSQTISGKIYADTISNNSYDSGEEIQNGWVYAEKMNSNIKAHAPVDATGIYTLGISDGEWKVYGAADGYSGTQYSESGNPALIIVSGSNVANKHIKLTTEAGWSIKTKSKPMTPASGGVIDDTAQNTSTGKSTGTGVKITVPPNALGSSNSSGNMNTQETSAVSTTNSMKPFASKGKNITATDNSGQPITNLSDYIDLEMVIYKAEIDAETGIKDFSKLKTMKVGYWDSTLNEWVNLSTTKTAYYKATSESTEWTIYNGTASQSGFEKFIDDALVNASFTSYTDYKLVFKAATNHLTVFAVGSSPDGVTPAAPSNIAQTAGSGTAVSISWDAVATNEDATSINDLYGYAVYRSTDGTTYSQISVSAILEGTETYTDASTVAFTSYYYKVTAGDDDDLESDYSTALQICSNNSVTNGTVAADCSITCNSGYTQSGNTCAAQSSGGGGMPLHILQNVNETNQQEDEDTSAEDTAETTTEEVVEAVKILITEIDSMISEAAEIAKGDINGLLNRFRFKRDLAKEQVVVKKYVKNLIKNAQYLTKEGEYSLTNFIAYGTETTLRLGEGERAGVINSYKSAFGKLPSTADEWSDAIKIANGRWPSETSAETEANAETAFENIYLRKANRSNPNDDAAVTVIAYGLRPTNRNLNSEKAAIKIFKAIYGYNPSSATAWDIVRAIAYSGATR